jgi:hypothetical protein
VALIIAYHTLALLRKVLADPAHWNVATNALIRAVVYDGLVRAGAVPPADVLPEGLTLLSALAKLCSSDTGLEPGPSLDHALGMSRTEAWLADLRHARSAQRRAAGCPGKETRHPAPVPGFHHGCRT